MYQPILLVSSPSTFQAKIISELEERGYFLIFAQSQQESIEAIEAGFYDVAIFPAEFEELDGLYYSAQIHRIWEETKIVILNNNHIPGEEYENLCKTHRIEHICSPEATPNEIALIVSRLAGAAPPMTRIPGLHSSIDSASPYDLFAQQTLAPTTISGNTLLENEEDQLQMEIRNLAREYQKTLPDELHQLKQLLKTAQQDNNNEESILAIRRLTHTVSGTAGTLGFTEIGEIVHQINERTKKIEQKGGGADDEWQTLYYLVDRAINTPERSSLVPTTVAAQSNVATILVIDADKERQDELLEIGAACMVNIITATTRVEAFAEIQAHDIDGVIIDLDMKTPAPVELAHELHSTEGLESLQVAFMSGNDTVDNRVAAASAGAMQFLNKPLQEDAFAELAREFSAQRSVLVAKVLIVDDDPFFRKHISNILASERLQVQELDEPQQILETLETVHPDILLLDVQMPTISGFDVCRMVRSVPMWRNLPVLFLTGESDVKVRIECFNVGGDDYIQKPCIKEELLARINVRLERIRLFKERADKDPLTRLLNRRAFLEQVTLRIDEGKRFERPLSFGVIDLDKFKHVNDTYGHLAGDRVLQATGKLLLSMFRAVDVRGRWGGEEFAVAFFNEDGQTAKKLLFEALKSLRKMVFTGDDGEEFRVTFSAGVSTFPSDAIKFDDLFKIADECLYEAKEAGRNRIYTLADSKYKE